MARYSNKIVEDVQVLRMRGYTYTEIQTAMGLKIPKSSLSYICKDLALPDTYLEKLERLKQQNLEKARKKALLANKKIQHKIVQEIYEQAEKVVPKPIDKTAAKLALAMLYLGEGSKRSGYRGLSLGSSSPQIIKLYIRLLDLCYGISLAQLKARVQYRADQSIDELVVFWAGITGLSPTQFYKTSPDLRTLGKPTRKTDYMGVCVISCKGTDKQLELQAITDILLNRVATN